MQIYLDNASSVPCEKHILERFAFLASEYFANQESLSCHGRKSAKAVKEAEEKIFTLLSADRWEMGGIVSGNTGSSVLAASIHALGSFLNGGVVTSPGEHASVLCALKRTSALYRFPVYYCPVGRSGELDLNWLKDLLKKEKIALAAFHHIQSETGCIQDLVSIRKVLDEYSPKTLFLADTVQSAGKYPLLWNEANLDLAFVSGQKIGCTGGGCVLYRKKLVKIFSALRGSTHLPGRCIPAHILLLAEILEKLVPEMEANRSKMENLKRLLLEKIKENDMAVAKIKEKKRSIILIVLLCALVCYFVATLISVQTKVRAQQNINESLSATHQQKLEENAELEDRIKNGKEEENIDRIAREEYGYALPDERVYYDSTD